MPTAHSILSTRTRLVVIAATLAISLTLINLQITAKQRIITEGTTILLELAPRDPRSLLQGDYMALRYAMADEVAEAAEAMEMTNGMILVEVDTSGVGKFTAVHGEQSLGKNHHLLRFRKRGQTVRLGSDAWHFEEGTGSRYRNARYGEFRVAEGGAAVLVGLRADKYEQIRD